MTYDQQLIFKQNSDSGDNDDASIQPLLTEPATPENADRPLQHLRRRTERVRAAVETLLYLADYDRAFALRSNAKFALADSGGNYTLSMVSGTEDDLWVYPALTPGRQSGGRNKGGRVYVGGLPYSGVLLTNDLAFTLHSDYTGQRGYADGSTFDGGGGNPALTLGANGVTLTLAANSGAPTGTISATITGSPKRKVTITYGTSGGSTSSTTSPDSLPVTIPMFAAGVARHQRSTCCGSALASFRPCAVNGCLPAFVGSHPFSQLHEPSSRIQCSGNTRHPRSA